MKTVNEVREEMGELDPIEFKDAPSDKFSISVYDEEMKPRIQQKRIHPIEWVLIGVMLTICGFLLIGIIEGFQWLLS